MAQNISFARTIKAVEKIKSKVLDFCVDLVGQFLFPSTDGLGEVLEHSFCVLPVDASIGDTDTVLKAGLALRGDLLVTCKTTVSNRIPTLIKEMESIPSLMLLSIMTPMIAVSPAAICSASTAATLGLSLIHI